MRDLSDYSMEQLWEFAGSSDYEERGMALRELGQRKSSMGEYGEAEDMFRASISVWEKAVVPGEEAVAWYGLGHLNAKQNRYREAEQDFRKASELFQTAGVFDGQLDALFFCAQTQLDQDKFDEALAGFELVIQQCELGNNWTLGRAHYRRGLVLERLFRQREAVQAYQLAEQHFVSGEFFADAAMAEDRLGHVKADMGLYESALSHELKALGTFEYLDTDERMVVALRECVAEKLIKLGRYDEAADFLTGVVSQLKQHDEPVAAASAELHLVECYAYMKQFDKAADLLNGMWAFVQLANNDRKIAGYYYVCGILARESGNLASAQDWFEQSLQHAQTKQLRRLVFASSVELAEVLLAQRKLDEVAKLFTTLTVDDFGDLIVWRVRFKLVGAEYFLLSGFFTEAENIIKEAMKLLKGRDMVSEQKRAKSLQRKISRGRNEEIAAEKLPNDKLAAEKRGDL